MLGKSGFGYILLLLANLAVAGGLSATETSGAEGPSPSDCGECERLFEEKLRDCTGPDGQITDEECLEEAERLLDGCFGRCDLPPEDHCYVTCEVALEEALAACDEGERNPDGTEGGGDEHEAPDFDDGFGECFEEAFENNAECFEDCLPEEVRCADDCRDAHYESIDACGDITDEAERAACVAAADDGLVQCALDCGAPEDGVCSLRCEIDYIRELERCSEDSENGEPFGPDGVLDDPECFERAHIAFERCDLECRDAGERACPVLCDLNFREALLDCEGAECDEAEATHYECLRECGIEPPEPDPCLEGCEEEFHATLAHCEESDDPECFDRAHLVLERCHLGCQDDEAKCPRLCDVDFKEAMLTCEDEGCDEVLGRYEQCHRECGVDVPDLPEPDRCLTRCDRAFNATLEQCFSEMERPGEGDFDGVGDDDEECFWKADEAYVECLEECGIDVPEPPPVHDNACVVECDASYEEAFVGCFNEDTGEVDEECVAAADRAYLGCLGECGVEIPQHPDVPGPPGNDCAVGCDEGLLGGLFECFTENGELAVDCVLGLVSRYEGCRSSCEDDAEDRIVGAALRQSQAETAFIRGDSNRDDLIEMTDAILVLEGLFVKEVTTACRDAFDANDDGQVDMSDPVRVLRWLFLGGAPLPEPSAARGLDPTPDDLHCR